ncbi:gag-pol polyprotein [Tanacetum coccineum]
MLCETWKAIERLKQGESINVQDLETNLYWEFGKFTSRDVLTSTTTRMAKRERGMDNRVGQVNVAGARENVGTPVVQKSGIQCYNCKEYGHVSRECQKPKRVKDAAYHKEKMLLCKQEEAGIHEVTPDPVDNSGPIFDDEPMHKVQNNNDNYNVFAMENEHPEQPESSNDIYLAEQGDTNITIASSDISKTKFYLVSSNKELVDKLKGEIEDFKTKNKSLESSNNHFKEANNELSKTNQLMFKDLKKFQAELDKYNDVNYASKVEIDLLKSLKRELCAHQETISIMSQAKEAQTKLYKTREDKELDKVIALENKVKVLNDIVYKTGQTVQTMNMLNRNCKTSFAKPEFLKKAQRANPRLYDIGCYNDNLALMLAPDSDETIHLEKERRSKLSDLIRPFDYDQLNNLL